MKVRFFATPVTESIAVFLLLVAICCSVASATESNGQSRERMLHSDASDFKSATFHMLKAPFCMKRAALLPVACAFTTVFVSSLGDIPARHHTTRISSGWAFEVANVGHAFQSVPVLFGSMGGCYLLGALIGKPGLRRCGLELMEAQLICGIGTQLTKNIVGRDRPYLNTGPTNFRGPSLQNAHHSFFSGDASVAFVQASVLSAELKSVPLAIVLYGLATSTAFQRLYADKHWLSDTVAAAIWGSAVGLGVVHLNRSSKLKGSSLGFSTNSIQFSYGF
ncbi:MAG: phosphatase PAP2 family protein [Calditrichaeota bacterium]|nr:phosphatase PAP2 family protein [Calditrichota bacterium]